MRPFSSALAARGGDALDTPVERFTISQLSQAFGVTARALRFYEEAGLLAPERRGNARIYSRQDRARLAWVLRAKRVGFSLTEIRELIDLYDLGDGRITQRRRTIAKCGEQISKLEQQREDIEGAISDLAGFLAMLEAAEAADKAAA